MRDSRFIIELSLSLTNVEAEALDFMLESYEDTQERNDQPVGLLDGILIDRVRKAIADALEVGKNGS